MRRDARRRAARRAVAATGNAPRPRRRRAARGPGLRRPLPALVPESRQRVANAIRTGGAARPDLRYNAGEPASPVVRFPVAFDANKMHVALVAFVAGTASCVLYCRRLASGVEGVRQNDLGAPRRKGRPFAYPAKSPRNLLIKNDLAHSVGSSWYVLSPIRERKSRDIPGPKATRAPPSSDPIVHRRDGSAPSAVRGCRPVTSART